ncbi:MAG: glycosyltransferase [Spirochaetes bacterium]|nr:glycosyltransferase [Spirochaetota bacterium]
MSKKPLISIIIPVAPEAGYVTTVSRIRKSTIPKNQYEVIIVFGNQPSVQRNEAVKKSRGDIIYFLDNDSMPDKGNLKRIIQFFRTHKKAAILGGPSLSAHDSTSFEQQAGMALGSFFGSAQSKARYSQTGKARPASEMELILCNMAVKKNIFLKAGMFNKNLYPNEENELINRIKDLVYEVWYDPEFVVYRHHRKNIFQFMKQIFTYGRGRADQFFAQKGKGTVFPIISLGFVIYLLFFSGFISLPLWSYIILNLSFSFYMMVQAGKVLLYLPFLFFIIHSFYGLGFLSGLFLKAALLIQGRSFRTAPKKSIWYRIQWIKDRV